MHLSYSSVFLYSAIFAVTIFLVRKAIWKRSHQFSPLPPGPSGLPLVGNVLQMPKSHPWLTFADWGKQYGNVVHISIFGDHIIILNSDEATEELLERRSALYSDRPILPMVGELVGYRGTTVLTPSGNLHRTHRKLISPLLASRKIEELHPIQDEKTRNFLSMLSASPDHFISHIRHSVAAIVFQITHGYTVAKQDDPLVALAERVNIEFGIAATPGAFLVDAFPILQHVPDWFPGAGFKRQAKKWRQTMASLRDTPYEFVKQQLANGTALPSFTASLIESNVNPTEEEEYTNKWVSATIYSAGADTTSSAITSFFLAMTVYPEIQRKAQEELDKVVGTTRLPNFEDRVKLPYIEAIVTEIHRWLPALPLAVPHKLMQDDVFEGFHIPSGSTVIPNTWAILHNPVHYPSPSEFIPERYVSAHEKTGLNPDPRRFAFGYGRRVCPGQYLADNSLYIAVAMVLSVFNISRAVDEKGQPIKPEVRMTSGTICHPEPFKCRITPRSPEAAALIRASNASA